MALRIFVALLMTGLGLILIGACDGQPAPASFNKGSDPFVQQLAASTPSTTAPVSIVTPAGMTWIVASPYALEAHWSDLGIKLSDDDKERLKGENVAFENVLVACLRNGEVIESNVLPGEYAASPVVFTVHGGDTIRIERRSGGRPLLIVKP